MSNKFVVQYKSISTGVGTARLSTSIALGELKDTRAVELFVNSRLKVNLVCDLESGSDIDGQEKMETVNTSVTIEGEAVVRGYSRKVDGFTVAFALPRDAVDLNVLAKFSGLMGMITCNKIGEAGE